MTMQLQGPFAGPVTITVLPNPDLSNTEGLDAEVDYRLSMDATPYTYVKSNEQRLLSFTFSHMGLGKLLELQEFQKAFAGSEVRLIDHRDQLWKIVFTDDSIKYVTNSRSNNSGGSRKESGTVTLELLGLLI